MREHIYCLPMYNDGNLLSWYQNDQKYMVPSKCREDYDEKKDKEIRLAAGDEELERQVREEEKKAKGSSKNTDLLINRLGTNLSINVQQRKAKHMWDMEKMNESWFSSAK